MSRPVTRTSVLFKALDKARDERLIENWEYPIYLHDIQSGEANRLDWVTKVLDSVGAL